jgi:hypothetical protein
MNAIRSIALAALMLFACPVAVAFAQDTAAPATDTAAPTGKEATYAELRKSKDRFKQQMADRYFNLVKLQDWASDKGTTITAKYVSHSPDLKSVTLSIAKGFGAARTMHDATVPVERLSKTCQSRVKQIATLQTRLDELAAKPDATDTAAAPGGEERGAERRPRTRAPRTSRAEREPATSAPPESAPASAAAPSGQPATTVNIRPDSSPDPLGFGELPAGPALPPGADIKLPTGPGAGPAANARLVRAADPAAEAKDKWRTNYEAFRASFRVGGSPAQPEVDFSAIPELKAAVNEVQKWEATGNVGDKEHQAIAKKFDAVGEFTWDATITDKKPVETDWTDCLDLPPLPEPMTIGFILDDKNPGNWAALKPGDRIRFVGHFVDVENGTDLVAHIRLPDDRSVGGVAPPEARQR